MCIYICIYIYTYTSMPQDIGSPSTMYMSLLWLLAVTVRYDVVWFPSYNDSGIYTLHPKSSVGA